MNSATWVRSAVTALSAVTVLLSGVLGLPQAQAAPQAPIPQAVPQAPTPQAVPQAPTPQAAGQSAGTFVPIAPVRLWEQQKVAAGGTLTARLSGLVNVPEGSIGAVVLNVTATPFAGGYLTVYPGGGTRPATSSLNYGEAWRPVANSVTVKVGAEGQVSFYNHSSESADLYVDVQGYYLAGEGTAAGALRSLSPVRVLDTRDGTGAPQRRVSNEAVTVSIAGANGVPANASAVLLNVTAVDTSMPGYITASPAGEPRPNASALNFPGEGQIRAGATVVKLGSGGAVDLFAASSGRLDLVADLSGYYLGGTPTEPGTFVALSPRRHLDQVVSAGEQVAVGVAGRADIPADAGAVVTTLTVDAPQRSGWFSATPSGTQPGSVSNLNFRERETRANLAVVKLGTDGAIWLKNGAAGSARGVSDVSGYFRASTQTYPLLTASSVVTRHQNTCVVDASRQVWCWGNNTNGQLGTGNTISTSVPTRLRNQPADVTAVRVSHTNTCVLAGPAAGGDVYCWGAAGGQNVLSPTKISGLPKVTHLSLDDRHACALAADGVVWCWSLSTAPGTVAPKQVGLSGVAKLNGMCAITTAGTAVCLIPQPNDTLAVTPVPDLQGVTAVNRRCAADPTGVLCLTTGTNQWVRAQGLPGGLVEIDNAGQRVCGRTTAGAVSCGIVRSDLSYTGADPAGLIEPARQLSLHDRLCVISQANELRCAQVQRDRVEDMVLLPVLGFQ